MSIGIARSSSAVRVPLAQALDLGPELWDDLRTRSEAESPFMTWAWHRAWAEAAASGEVGEGQAVVLRSPSGDVEGLFPFRIQRTRFRRAPVAALGWALGDLGCPDHLELLASPEADLDALVSELERIPWDIIRLRNVADRAPHVEQFGLACARRNWSVQRRALWRCPYLELPGSWDAYLSSLSANRRQIIRRKERALRRNRDVVLTEYDRARFEEGWRHLVDLHACRWVGGGVFREPGMERLHRSFASSLADQGRLWLATLDLNGQPAVAWYGFSLGDTVYYYQGGWDPRWERDSVGMILMGIMIRRAIERGYRLFDFLRGEEDYKTGWTRTARSCYEVVVTRTGWRGAVLRGLDWMARQRAARWPSATVASAQHT